MKRGRKGSVFIYDLVNNITLALMNRTDEQNSIPVWSIIMGTVSWDEAVCSIVHSIK